MSAPATRRIFLRGLAALLPTVVTVIIFYKLYDFIKNTVGAGINWLIAAVVTYVKTREVEKAEIEAFLAEVPPILGTILAIALMFLVALFVGLVLASFIGRKVWTAVEKRLFGIPIVRLVYPSIKQITDFVFGEPELSFKRVGLLEYPRKGVYSIGFITGTAFASLQQRVGREMVTFFIPSSPTPFTGYCVQVFRDEVTELDVPVEAAIRYIVSGGVILPIAEGGDAESVQAALGSQHMRESQATGEDVDSQE
ncbi:MAG: DUF502 domain-containing protein [Planctomycetota bacterium]|jgi:uncharacterized membrane protein